LPERFLIAEEHNHDKALERWRDTLRWRNEKKVDDVLNVPHSQYDAIKQYYPQFFHCRDRMGNMVYIERPGGVNLSRIKKHGITVKKLIWHYMYCIEYLWQRFSPLETDRLTTILDLKGGEGGAGRSGSERSELHKEGISANEGRSAYI